MASTLFPSRRSRINTRSESTSKITPETDENVDPLAEFDEHGTELHKEARVWNVYVEETDKYDAELVKEWNDSTDVILIFAALFSAISTTFLIESSKMLQEDTSDVATQALLGISQALLSIANGTQPPGPASLPEGNSTNFTPSRKAIYVNALWYLSLSLSLATSFIAILAKDWCHSFMRGRTGHPYSQTARRQQKWDMIERWKMFELLTVLPSLIHIALVLFAIGLCIFLWDTHPLVAIPVVCTSGAAFGFYVCLSIAATIWDFFPYPTIISRICRTEFAQRVFRVLYELPFGLGLILGLIFAILVGIISLVFKLIAGFSSLLKYLQVPSSYHCLPLRILISPLIFSVKYLVWYPADKVQEWLDARLFGEIDSGLDWLDFRIPNIKLEFKRAFKPGQSSGSEDPDAQRRDDVTSRALGWLIKHCEVPRSVDIALQSIAGATNRISRQPLQDCQAALEILRRLVSSNLYRSSDDKADAVVSLYSRALSFLSASGNPDTDKQRQVGDELEVSIWHLQAETEKKLADMIVEDNFDPTKNNLAALRIGSTVASNSLKILGNDSQGVGTDVNKALDSITKLLESHVEGTDVLHKAALLSLVYAATLYLLFSPTSVPEHRLLQLCVQISKDRSVDALFASFGATCVLVYNMHQYRKCKDQPSSLIWLKEVVRGLIERYSQQAKVLQMIYTIEPPDVANGLTEQAAHQCLARYISRLDNNFLSNNQNAKFTPFETKTTWTQFGTKANLSRGFQEDITLSELHELDTIYHLTSITALNPVIYLYVVEVMCRAQNPSSPLWALGAQLISRCRFPILSEELTIALEQRDIVSLLEITNGSKNRTKRCFATGQLWLLFSLYIHAQDTARGRDALKVQLKKYRKDSTESEIERRAALSSPLWGEVGYGSVTARELGTWVFRLEECVLQSLGLINGLTEHPALLEVPQELRGLSSFTGWNSQASIPSTEDTQPVGKMAANVGVSSGADTMTQRENATSDSKYTGSAPSAADAEDAGDARDAGKREVGAGAETDFGNELATQQGPVNDIRNQGKATHVKTGEEGKSADANDAPGINGLQTEGETVRERIEGPGTADTDSARTGSHHSIVMDYSEDESN